MRKGIKYFLFLFLMMMFWIPLFQQITGYFKETELRGAFVVPKKPLFSIDSLKTTTYQKQLEDYENSNFGFRAFTIRVKNTLDFLLYKKINVEDQVEGQNGYIFSKTSLDKTFGLNYNGLPYNETILSKVNDFRNDLKKHGVQLIALFAPSKEIAVPENLPNNYRNIVPMHTDNDDFINGYKKYNIPYIDFASYFKKISKTSPHQLFTKTGFHWSPNGSAIAQDTLFHLMQQFQKEPLLPYIHDGFETSDTARDSDADFEAAMNLLYNLNQPSYVYPKLKMDKTSLAHKRPKVIIIGDSFFWQIKNLKVMNNVFSDDSKFWYYFATNSFPLSDAPPEALFGLDIVSELQTADFVILIGSFSTYGNFPFGVTDYYFNHSSECIFNSLFQYEKAHTAINNSNQKNVNTDSVAFAKSSSILKHMKTIQMVGYNGKYVCADGGRKGMVTADKVKPSAWETFNILRLNNNLCAICSYEHKFVSADLGMNNEVAANRPKMADWEIFTIENLENNMIALKAANGKYLTVDEKTLQLFANSNSIGEKEKFSLITK
jgi:hypothetical protein